ncbi:MAG: hypothetical protein J7641_02760 [Cyanobacteria bacterium SID2]|nr:hypothetical protein [Cyanobacteria bacterium SID2]MBP0003859.1 hypothetical protein [Cyanobacteria bacterium SBC]
MTLNDTLTNVLIGDSSNDILSLIGRGTGILIGFGGDDTLTSSINGQKPGSQLFGNRGQDYLESKGIGDTVFGGRDGDTIFNETGQAVLSGDRGRDSLFGEEGNYILLGGLGDDYAFVKEAENLFIGHEGDDRFIGEGGLDTAIGGDGDDNLQGNGRSILAGNAGKDTLESRAVGNDEDSLLGGRDGDYLLVGSTSNADNPVLLGEEGNDRLRVQGTQVDAALLIGDGTDAGDDRLFVAGGNRHLLFGNRGDDELELGEVGSGVELLGGKGKDRLTGKAVGNELFASGDEGNDNLNLSASGAQLWGDNPNATENFGNDVVRGVGNNNRLAGDNDNAATANGGNDELVAVGSNNLLLGFSGNDELTSEGSGGGNTLIGGVGNDTYTFQEGDIIPFDDDGINIYIGNNADRTPVTLQSDDSLSGRATFIVLGDENRFINIEGGGVVVGSGIDRIEIQMASGLTDAGGGNDTLEFETVSGTVRGGDGNDVMTVSGRAGLTSTGRISGGDGDDTLSITRVAGTVEAGAGDDSLTFETISPNAFISTGNGDDLAALGIVGDGVRIDGDDGNDSLTLSGLGTADDATPTTLSGGDGSDTLGIASSATVGTNTAALVIDAGVGDDFLQGRQYAGDRLLGGNGNDTLFGGVGNLDEWKNVAGSLRANTGTVFTDGDILSGGAGADIFLFTDDRQTARTEVGTVGSGVTVAPGAVIGTSGQTVESATGTNVGDIGTVNPALHVDTITDFNFSEGDRIIVNENDIGFSISGTGVDFIVFSGGTLLGNLDATPNNSGDFIFANFPGFPVAGTSQGVISYDRQTGGLYFGSGGDPDSMSLLVVLSNRPNLTQSPIVALPENDPSAIRFF